ncbi:M50 family metallopeptidase [Cellulosimicrobium arenosum]|uniref:M50 family metallopeptidase n=1 Tax=Cellulosimicrobium arenosum TaxID=2708133 RepID=A0A927IZU9_9MICO|nr:M50 family metallopeptidase [Cellulosimicrobium arenosum]
MSRVEPETDASVWTGVTDVVGQVWDAATTSVAPPEPAVVLAMGAVASSIVLVTPVWHVARHVVTIAHEGAHALAALLTGRQLSGIRLHSDTSGLTVSAGRPRGFGMILTAFMGYVGPGLVGLGAAALLRQGYAVGLLWLLVLLLGLVLLQIRNWFGLWSVLVSGAALVGVSWWAPPDVQSAVAYAVTWFLLLGAVRPVLELQVQRSRGLGSSSDADILARLTHLPGLLWVGVFLVVTLGAAALGAWWIVGPAT